MNKFVIRFTVRQVGMPEGVAKKRKRTVPGLNLLDAHVRLRQIMRLQGLTVHSVLEIEELPREKSW